MMRIVILIAAFIGLSSPAFAQVPPYVWPFTIGTTSIQVLGTDVARKRAIFINPNNAAFIFCNPAIRRDTGAALPSSLATKAGMIPILPYGSFTVDSGTPSGPVLSVSAPWNCISDTPGSFLTIVEYQ